MARFALRNDNVIHVIMHDVMHEVMLYVILGTVETVKSALRNI